MKGNEMLNMKNVESGIGGKPAILHSAFFALSFLIASAAWAMPTVNVTSVVQRWPWNNKVDIKYNVTEGQEVANAKYRRMEFVATIAGTTFTIDGNTLAAPTETGSHRVTWTCPAGFKATDCAMVAKMYESDVPSGDDYMIVNLTNGVVTYEGLCDTQTNSNVRYNTAAYKENLMVFRKVPAGTYTTGHSDYTTTASGRKWWNSVATKDTTRAYYIGVFPVTQYQYEKVYGSNPSTYKTSAGDVVAHRPVDGVSWYGLRGDTLSTSNVAPDANGTFIAKFNARTSAASGLEGFDLPSEFMYEIAERAGRTTRYSWGDDETIVSNYCVCSYGLASALTSTRAVGSRLPNDWGIYDTVGNMSQWMLDTLPTGGGNMQRNADLSPRSDAGNNVFFRGGDFDDGGTSSVSGYFCASNRGWLTTRSGTTKSFRMAYVVK